ncbi:MAG: hypothetical protein V1755_13275 [Chloroflexota bacterium]
MKHAVLNMPFVSMLFLAACAPSTPLVQAPEPTAVAISTLPVPPTDQPLSFVPATYRDEANRFELDYPSDWSLDPNTQVGSRGSQAQLFSPGTTAETLAEGGSRLSITIYDWDPKGDLDAYVTQRRTAWDASGFAVKKESTLNLLDGREAAAFLVQVPSVETFFLYTTLGDRYLQIAGEGDLTLVAEIANTFRPTNFQP